MCWKLLARTTADSRPPAAELFPESKKMLPSLRFYCAIHDLVFELRCLFTGTRISVHSLALPLIRLCKMVVSAIELSLCVKWL